MRVYYWGAGTGKSTYAKSIATDHGYSYYISSGSNDILDDYAGQECIILDDLRASCIGLSDLLKMLDNNTASTVKSRYKNKVLECKLIIITTTQEIDTFFRNVFADDIESSVQLKRRCETHVELTMEDAIVRVWQKAQLCYGREFVMPNPVKVLQDIETLDAKQQAEKALSVLGKSAQALLDMVNDVREHSEDYGIELSEVKSKGKLPF